MVLPRHKLRGLSVLNVALVAVVVAIAVSAYLLFFKSDSQAAGTTRPSVAVSRGDVTASVSSSGTLQSPQTASPQFETSGTVTSVLVKVGQVVANGATIAKIDPSAAERAVRIADQNQTAAADSVTAAEQTLDDAQEAVDAAEATPTPTPGNGQQNQSQGQSPEVALTNAKASLARAKADKEQADQNLEGAQADLAATTLKAPIAGTVTAINGTVGSVAGGSGNSTGSSGSSGTGQGSTGTTSSATASSGGFVDISDLKSLQVVAAFPEADAIKIKAKQSATVTLNAEPGTTLTATLTSVSPTPTTTNGVVSYSATFALAKLPDGARIGQTANVSVQTAKASNVLYVPSTAIVTSGTSHTVTMADGSGTREVQLGVRGDSFTQITSGLNEGDRVELIQGAIGGGTAGGTGQGRNGQFPGGQFPAGGIGTGTGGGINRGR
ncbi:macrolide-specific efflux system membrane fusion protein [Kribbella voronezhensis]|uniref:Macrolide-specific efflux system membrane fusion protein n=1 Tax=Kribbella voronezhensis TaxID=2512212 RepID=A0A4V3FIZ2_9ACTN|nr:HlyD family efflux transporter periplasmic adaptor subunit [Kribbella voronezhensis]TDU84243.1 macrolide-specific efflux system membrane fusion protein [Kribbella voronezhensis]